MKKRPSYYDILRVNPHSSDAEIKRAYLFWAKKFHPDRNPENKEYAALRFGLVREAYEAIKTTDKRVAYNAQIAPKPENDNSSGFFSQLGEFFWPQQGKR